MGTTRAEILKRNENLLNMIQVISDMPEMTANCLKKGVVQLGPTLGKIEGIDAKVAEIKSYSDKLANLRDEFTGSSGDWQEVLKTAQATSYQYLSDFNQFIADAKIQERTGTGSTSNFVEFSFLKDGKEFVATDNKLAELWLGDKNNRKSVESRTVKFEDSIVAFMETNGLQLTSDEKGKNLGSLTYRMSKQIKSKINEPYFVSNPDVEGKRGRPKKDSPENTEGETTQ
jgi:hypothetical protein